MPYSPENTVHVYICVHAHTLAVPLLVKYPRSKTLLKGAISLSQSLPYPTAASPFTDAAVTKRHRGRWDTEVSPPPAHSPINAETPELIVTHDSPPQPRPANPPLPEPQQMSPAAVIQQSQLLQPSPPQPTAPLTPSSKRQGIFNFTPCTVYLHILE